MQTALMYTVVHLWRGNFPHWRSFSNCSLSSCSAAAFSPRTQLYICATQKQKLLVLFCPCFSPLIPLASAASDQHLSVGQLFLQCIALASLNDSLIHMPEKRTFPEHIC